MSEPAGPFKVVLHSVDDMWKNSRVRSEVSRLFQIDDETASNIVSAIPIVVIDGLDARTAGIVRERLRSLAEGGCRVVTTDDPADTIPRVNWPEPPEIARVPAEELRGPGEPARTAAPDHGPPLLTFSCPGCGHSYHLMRAAPGTVAVVPPVAHGQVGALVKPGVGAPSGGKPGTNGDASSHAHVAVQAQSHPAHKEPEMQPAHARSGDKANGSARHDTPAATAAADEPGPKLAGDEWMDPPITPAPLKAPSKALAPVKAKTPEPAPAPPPPPAPLPTPAASSPRPQAAPSRLAAGPAGTGSLLDDPLLVARSFESVSNPMSGNSDPSTFTAKPITSRFSRNVVPQNASAQAAPAPVAARAQPAPVAPAPSAAAPPSRSGTTRFAPPPPPKSSAPPPSPPRAASISSSALDEELDVHFDEASDLEAAEKLPREREKEPRPPSGVEEDPERLLDSDDLDMISSDPLAEVKSSGARARAARTEAPAARRPMKPLADSDDDDDMLFDEGSSRGKKKEPVEKAPAKPEKREAAKREAPKPDPFDSSNADDLLDEPPQATVTRKPQPAEASRRGQEAPAARRGGGEESSRRGREPAPAPDSEESELLLDDEPSTRKGVAKPKGRSTLESDDDDDALFGSDERPPAKGARGAPPRKSKAPAEDDFEDALDMFADGDESPLDDGRGLDAAAAAEDVPEIQPLDLASDVSGSPSKNSATKSGKRKAESPFDKPSSSAILEPLDPNEAMAILKTHNQDDGDPGASTGHSNDDPPGPSGDLEPLDPNEALAILGTPEDRPRSGKTPPRVRPRQKNGRGSEASKLVPLSASDEDFAFLEGNKAKAKKTDPFARARGGDDGRGGSPSKKRSEEQPRGRAADTEAALPPGKVRSKSDGRSERSAPPPPSKQGGGGGGGASRRPPAGVAEGTGECGLVLPRISSDDKRQKAAELISEIKGVSRDDAMKLTERTIIPVLTGVSREVAEFHREKFERNKISARVTTRQKEK